MVSLIHKEVKQKSPSIVDGFRQFARNGRWGTCGFCPKDSEGHSIPEACEHQARYDHNLTAEQLAEVYKNHSEA